MLERGVACVEPSVQRLTRHIERSVRSKKTLGAAFWAHVNQQHLSLSWWALFFEFTKPSPTRRSTQSTAVQDRSTAPYLDFLYPHHGRCNVSTLSSPIRPSRSRRSRSSRLKHVSAYSTSSDTHGPSRAKEDSTAEPGLAARDFWNSKKQTEFELKSKEFNPPTKFDTVSGDLQQLKNHDSINDGARRAAPDQNSVLRVMKEEREEKTQDDQLSASSDNISRILQAITNNNPELACQLITEFGNINGLELTDADDIGAIPQGTRQYSDLFMRLATEVGNQDPIQLDFLLSLASSLKDAEFSRKWNRAIFSRFARTMLRELVNKPKFIGTVTPQGIMVLIDAYHAASLLTPGILISAIKSLTKISKSRSRPSLAIVVYRALRHRFPNHILGPPVYGALMSILSGAESPSTDRIRFVLSEFTEQHGQPDKSAYQLALTACARNGDVQAVEEIIAEYAAFYGPPKHQAIWNPLLSVYARTGNVSKVQKLVDELRFDRNIIPDLKTWNTLIAAYARADDLVGAIKVFKDMKTAKVKPDRYTLSTLMGIPGREGDIESVLYLASEAEKSDVPVNTAILDILIRSYCQNDDWAKAEEVLEAAMKMRVEGDLVRLWNSLLVHHAHRGHTGELLRLQQRMKDLNVIPDSMSYSALMLCLTKIGRTEDALKILRALHLGNLTTVTITHYAIVMHGFAFEGNRDQVTRLYLELLQHFDSTNLSVNLAVLKTQLMRDELAIGSTNIRHMLNPIKNAITENSFGLHKTAESLQLPHASKFLDNILDNVDTTDLAWSKPNPGIGRLKASNIISTSLLKDTIRVLGRYEAFNRISELIAKYRRAQKHKTHDPNATLPDELAGEVLRMFMIRRKYKLAEKYWRKSLILAIQNSVTKKNVVQSLLGKPEDKATPKDVQPKGRKILDDPNLKIMPAHRFALKFALNSFMHVLGRRGREDRLLTLVEKLLNVGFALSSKNWNSYVQLMANSRNPEHQFIAFATFEDRMVNNLPTWSLLKRGKFATQDSEDEISGEATRISQLESTNRDEAYPHYFTMVYLGAALTRFRRRSALDQGEELYKLLKRAPKTVLAVSKMPYLKDRTQGVLLRGRLVRGDLPKTVLRQKDSAPYGLLGSSSGINDVPLPYLPDAVEMQGLRSSDNGNTSTPAEKQRWLEMADILLGEVPIQQQNEPGDVAALEDQRIDAVHQMLDAAERPAMIADQSSGFPATDPFQVRDVPNRNLFQHSDTDDSINKNSSFQIRKIPVGRRPRKVRNPFNALKVVAYSDPNSKRRKKKFSRNRQIERQRQIQARLAALG